MSTEEKTWTDDARRFLDGYLQQVEALLASQGADAQEIAGDLREHIMRLTATTAGSLVTVPDVKRMLATVGTPEEVAMSWAQLGGQEAQQDPWAAPYLNVPPPSPSRTRAWIWAVAAAALLCLPVIVWLLRGEGAVPDREQAPSPTPVTTTPTKTDLIGTWRSVDFVQRVEDFQRGVQSWQGDLYLKDLVCYPDGRTSIGYKWSNGLMATADARFKAPYYVKVLDGDSYLFLPWFSGDVTIRGEKPRYYVLSKTAAPTQTESTAAPQAPPVGSKPGAQETPAPEAEEAAAPAAPIDLTGRWDSVDFVTQVEDFKPGTRSWRGDLFLKNLTCYADGRTSLGYTWWANGWMAGQDGRTRAKYYVKEMNGQLFLFLPWLSGDVTMRGMAPKYYVLRRTSR